MQEVFKSKNTDILIFDDKGITYHDSGTNVSHDINHLNNAFFPYGSLKDVTFNGLFRMIYVHYKIDGEVRILAFVYDKADKVRVKNTIEFARKEMSKAIPGEVVNLDKTVEHKMYCNVCKKVYCFSEDDIRKNQINSQLAKSAQSRAVTEILIGNRMIAESVSKNGDDYQDKIVDFNKCPNCGSSDVKELSEDEFEKAQETKATSLSSADEIKKFKELLDSGVITQEEFDAKKKQLLGL